MNESFDRLGQALVLGLVLLYFSLVPAFKSWLHPLTIMSAIPLALIGAAWSMLLAGKHGCMPKASATTSFVVIFSSLLVF